MENTKLFFKISREIEFIYLDFIPLHVQDVSSSYREEVWSRLGGADQVIDAPAGDL